MQPHGTTQGEPERQRTGRPPLGSRPQSHNVEALVLRTFDDGEADRVAIVLTPDRGKLRARVRGARRITSRLGGHVDALTRAKLSLALGARMDVVAGAESIEAFGTLKADLVRLAAGIYLAELVGALLPYEDPHPVTYNVTIDALRALNSGSEPQAVTRCAELRLLADAGYAPELNLCVMCSNEIQQGRHRYAPSQGGVVCDGCTVDRGQVMPLSVNALKVMRHFSRATDFSQATQLTLDERLLQEVEEALAGSLREVLERQTRSSVFIDHLRNLRRPPAVPQD